MAWVTEWASVARMLKALSLLEHCLWKSSATTEAVQLPSGHHTVRKAKVICTERPMKRDREYLGSPWLLSHYLIATMCV